MELRCDNEIKFGELDVEDARLEVKCRSKRCGAGPGIVVIHEFDLHTGKILDTRKFREPVVGRSV